MATRGHVQDPNDRRLRPIYDYLDNGNNKMAIQQADKLLKKHKDLHCAKVLKSIGLQRTGKQDEAFNLAQEVATLEPTDDNSLQALTILYREMQRPELVTKLYEAAVKKVPLSEEYHSHLFMAYARVGEYKKMQQAGMTLYKIVPKNPYYFWSVMSLVMQAISAQDEKLAQTMFLPLAERMVEKMVKEDKIEAEAEVQLYFMILERLGKCVEALDVVRGPLGEKLTSELQSRETKSMMLYKRLQQWPECNALSYKLLLKNPDDWQFYLSYFDSLFHLMDQSWSPPQEGDNSAEGKVHCSMAEAVRFIQERIAVEDAKQSRPLRGPYLARLELIHRLGARGCREESQLGDENMVWQCLGLLDDGLSHSPANAQFKLLQLLLFCRLGAFEPVVDLYSSLDAKHVQHDTIGYLLTRYAESLGQFAAASQSCNFSLRFFHSNQKDTSEYIIQAYKYGAFEKIPEFIAFRSRLNQSLHFAQVRTERMLLDLYLEADISLSLEDSVKVMGMSPEEDDIPWDNMRDNRDLTVFTSWEPKDRQLTEEHKRLSVEEESIWLRIRSLTLRLIASLALLIHAPSPRISDKTNENGVMDKTMGLNLLSQLEQTLQAAAQMAEKPTQYPFLGPPSTRLVQALSSGSCHCQAAALQLSVKLQELETAGLDDSSELQTQICNSFKSLVVQLQEILNKSKGDLLEMKDNRLKTKPSLLENLVFFVETMCLTLWVASYCANILRPLKSNLQKKKKKKKDTNTALPAVVCGFQELSGSLQSLLIQALEYIRGQETNLTSLKLAGLTVEDDGTFIKAAMDKVLSSYLRSLQELGDLLKKRAETIKSLKI
ncbi:N-alpha-acetyltransferase 25, NatB auxiliary subunit isoform X3 [Osmerus mordax]|uniref:N-alpha-acetyltransferase 25, NatB auxiliary subunit isoform X3 n=1 Tax=Osmerus mordax TaxID=8014 RepID=UPI00351031E9